MPFTPAHPAIVLPFLNISKRLLSPTGLVAGSLAPDFEYFLRMKVGTTHSHTAWGLIYFDLPLAVIIAILFHVVVKRNLISNLPIFLQRRGSSVYQCDFMTYVRSHPFALIAGCLAGSLSHLFWDNFTHKDGLFVKLLPFYSAVVPYEEVKYPLYYALQHISTAVGLVAVTLYIVFLRPDQAANVTSPRVAYWLMAALWGGIVLFLRFGLEFSGQKEGDIVVSCITALCCAILLNGVIKFRPASA